MRLSGVGENGVEERLHVQAACAGENGPRRGLPDGNRTHISRLGGACTIHYATGRSGRIVSCIAPSLFAASFNV